MDSVVIAPGQYGELKKKALRTALLERHEPELAHASENERKRILAAIEAEIEATIAKDLEKWKPAERSSDLNIEPKIVRLMLIALILIVGAYLGVMLCANGHF